MNRIEQGLRPPTLACAEPELLKSALPGDILNGEIDDATTAYVMATRVPFDLLRQVSGQLAGLMVLAAAGGRSAQDHPMLRLAEQYPAEALDGLRAAQPPIRAVHHHIHLMKAARTIALALRRARAGLHQRDDASLDAVMGPLRAGFRQLRCAAAALPGFEIVAFEQGCCAAHRDRPPGGLKTSISQMNP